MDASLLPASSSSFADELVEISTEDEPQILLPNKGIIKIKNLRGEDIEAAMFRLGLDKDAPSQLTDLEAEVGLLALDKHKSAQLRGMMQSLRDEFWKQEIKSELKQRDAARTARADITDLEDKMKTQQQLFEKKIETLQNALEEVQNELKKMKENCTCQVPHAGSRRKERRQG